MAHISIKNLSVEFKVYGSSSRSLKNELLSQATGGRIAENSDDAITVKALDNVSLEINDGDRIGLVGHNGAGKSTLLRTLAGIYKPTSGSIEIDGTVGTLIDPSAGMDPEATGIENIYLRGYVLGMTKDEINEKVDGIADFTELGDFLKLPVKTYSAGMFARLGFAISTVISPDILLIDEGIGAGDAHFMEKINKKLESFLKVSPVLLFASHDQGILSSFCNKELRFSQGKIYQ